MLHAPAAGEITIRQPQVVCQRDCGLKLSVTVFGGLIFQTPHDDRDCVPVGTQDGRAVPQAVQPQSEDIFLAFMEMAVPAVRKIARASF